jgi:folate-dependent phosphoribosylglycinamide formyltransferase PurN
MNRDDLLRPEEPLNRRVERDQPGARFEPALGARWGELLVPPAGANPGKTGQGLRLVLVASSRAGQMLLETAQEYERRHPDRLDLVALVTDDPVNPDARISVKRRIWHLMDEEHRLAREVATVESALRFGVPVYTGEVKSGTFHRQLAGWAPDAILMCGFGQLVDGPILSAPPLGMYNLHPSDLRRGHGAGPAPFDDLAARGAQTTCWTLHEVIAELDAGGVVGCSPPVRVVDAAGQLPENPLVLFDKMTEALPFLVARALDALTLGRRRLEQVDFEALMPQDARDMLLEPVRRREPLDTPPVPPAAAFE